MCDQNFYTWAQKNNETRLNHVNVQLKINNYKIVIPCVTKKLIHETKRNLILKKMQPRNRAKTLNVQLTKICKNPNLMCH
jgi:hypothetical protein